MQLYLYTTQNTATPILETRNMHMPLVIHGTQYKTTDSIANYKD